MRSGIEKKVREIIRTATFPVTFGSAIPYKSHACLPAFAPDVRISEMKFFAACAVLLLVVASALAQAPQGSPSPGEIAALEKKIDQINTKIDALSQQILKLEQ